MHSHAHTSDLVKILQEAGFKPLDTIFSRDLLTRYPVISTWFKNGTCLGDNHGKVRVLGDLLGARGLHLRPKLDNNAKRIPCAYIMPFTLPVVVDDCVIEEPKYDTSKADSR